MRIARGLGIEPPHPVPHDWLSLAGRGICLEQGYALSSTPCSVVSLKSRYLILPGTNAAQHQAGSGTPLLQLIDEYDDVEARP